MIKKDNMWYQVAKSTKTSQTIRGEYWLTENGLIYADGDYGNDNHEIIAESYMLNDILGVNFNYDGDSMSYDEANNMFYSAVYDGNHVAETEQYLDSLISQYGESEYVNHADFEDYIHWINSNRGRMNREFVNSVIVGFKDPRKYVMQNRDWVRVQQENIEVWSANNESLRLIARYIPEIIEEEGEEYDKYDEEENWKYVDKYNFYILSTDKYFPRLSYDSIIRKEWIRRSIDPVVLTTNRARPSQIPMYKYEGG